MERRNLLRAGVVGIGAAAFSGALWREAFAAPAQPGPGPYGALQAANANGIQLPSGFTSRIIARSTQTVSGTSYAWHRAPDGGACFADGTGWIYVIYLTEDETNGCRPGVQPGGQPPLLLLAARHHRLLLRRHHL